jgi:hypothetical protein
MKLSKIAFYLVAFVAATQAHAEYTMTPDGNYVSGSTYSMTPDGKYVGGSSYSMTPNGGSGSQLMPNGQYIGR